jgi:sigma54-dependent transcription regulator
MTKLMEASSLGNAGRGLFVVSRLTPKKVFVNLRLRRKIFIPNS